MLEEQLAQAALPCSTATHIGRRIMPQRPAANHLYYSDSFCRLLVTYGFDTEVLLQLRHCIDGAQLLWPQTASLRPEQLFATLELLPAPGNYYP